MFVFMVDPCCALICSHDSYNIPQRHHSTVFPHQTFRVFHENIQCYIDGDVFYDNLFFYILNLMKGIDC